jgi:hypothetical protein
MELRRRAIHRLTRLFVRWNLISHPYGREYARNQFTLTGRRVSDADSARPSRSSGFMTPQRKSAVIAMTLLLVSFLAAGVLLASV